MHNKISDIVYLFYESCGMLLTISLFEDNPANIRDKALNIILNMTEDNISTSRDKIIKLLGSSIYVNNKKKIINAVNNTIDHLGSPTALGFDVRNPIPRRSSERREALMLQQKAGKLQVTSYEIFHMIKSPRKHTLDAIKKKCLEFEYSIRSFIVVMYKYYDHLKSYPVLEY